MVKIAVLPDLCTRSMGVAWLVERLFADNSTSSNFICVGALFVTLDPSDASVLEVLSLKETDRLGWTRHSSSPSTLIGLSDLECCELELASVVRSLLVSELGSFEACC